MSSKYSIIYLFENPNLLITEIKRLDLSKDAEASDIFHWLYLDKKTGALIKLWFHSMDSAQEIEERYFEQGYLKFNKVQATFIEKYNSAQHTLDNQSNKKIDHELSDQINAYLKENH